MRSGLSQKADIQQQSKLSLASQNHDNMKTSGRTTSTRLNSNSLPHECEAILKDADNAIDMSSIDALYAGVFLNKKRKKYWIDKVSYGNCFLVYARYLSIAWGKDFRYWRWPYVKETSEEVVECAELIKVCLFQIDGKFEISRLTPGIKYEVVFVVMLKDPVYGWEVPTNLRLVTLDGNKQEHKENFMEKPRSKWLEIPVGEFMVEPKNEGFIEFSLYGSEGGAWKMGLWVKGVAIRPKH